MSFVSLTLSLKKNRPLCVFANRVLSLTTRGPPKSDWAVGTLYLFALLHGPVNHIANTFFIPYVILA